MSPESLANILKTHLPPTSLPDALPRCAPPLPQPLVVRAFVDFWNFQIALDGWQRRFCFDWSRLGPSLTAHVEALWTDALGRPVRFQYGGLHLYLSYDPTKPRDEGLRKWAHGVLARFEGVHIVLTARQPKQPPTCPGCHAPVATCPCCHASMHRTTEKGMDTAIVTDMLRLAWERSWNIAVLLSADGDFIPAVQHLQDMGHPVVHAGFAPHRCALSRACSASFDVTDVLRSIERRGTATNSVRGAAARATAHARRILTETRGVKENRENRTAGSQNQPERGLTG